MDNVSEITEGKSVEQIFFFYQRGDTGSEGGGGGGAGAMYMHI